MTEDIETGAGAVVMDRWKCLKCGEEFEHPRGEEPLVCPNPNCRRRWMFKPLTGPFTYFHGKRFLPKKLADEIMQEHRFATHRESWVVYRYADGCYLPDGEALIREECRKRLGKLATEHYVNEVVAHIRDTTFRSPSDFEPPARLVCVQNGILDLETMQLYPHTPDIIFLNKLPASWDPTADCPGIRKFLEEVVPDERERELLLEFVGYCLLREYPFQKALMLAGDGANGKSTFLNVVRALLGRENVANRSLQELAEDRFAAADLYGKLANIFYDLPSDAIRSTGTFKALTGGDAVKGEKKFQQPFSFTNYAKLMFSANQLPRVSEDLSDAFFRRWIIVTFPNKFEGERADKELLSKLTTPEELSGLLRVAVEHLKALLERGEFSVSPSTEEIRQEYLRKSDPVGAFVMDCLLADPGVAIEKKDLYGRFCEYCRAEKLPPASDVSFFRRLQTYVQIREDRPQVEGKRIRVIAGITYNPERVQVVQHVQEISYSILLESKLSPFQLKERKKLDILDTLDRSATVSGTQPIGTPAQNEEKIGNFLGHPGHLGQGDLYNELYKTDPENGRPTAHEIMRAIADRYHGMLVGKDSMAEELKVPLERLRAVLEEMARRGMVVDRGDAVEVM